VFADSAQELSEVYQDLSQTLMWKLGRDEATSFVALAAGLALLASVSTAQLKRKVF
jgi:kynureninase